MRNETGVTAGYRLCYQSSLRHTEHDPEDNPGNGGRKAKGCGEFKVAATGFPGFDLCDRAVPEPDNKDKAPAVLSPDRLVSGERAVTSGHRKSGKLSCREEERRIGDHEGR